MKYAIGVDFGGTKIATGIVDEKGNICKKTKILSEVEKGKKNVINKIVGSIKDIIETGKITPECIIGTGIGSPGPLDAEKGIIHCAPNLPGWKEVPLAEEVKKYFGFPVYVDNDANLAGFGESWIGAGKSAKYLLFVTLGTGVGGGLIFNGKIFHGAEYGAAEIGHQTVVPDGRKCNCSNFGCLERYCSAGGILMSVQEYIACGKKTILNKEKEITSEKVYKAALRNDKVAISALKDAGKYLGIGLANAANLLNLDIAVIGGNVAEAGDFILVPAREEFKNRAVLYPIKKMKILKASLGPDAGIIGAARLVFQ